MSALRHFLMVRHGQTTANAQGIIQGQLQTDLSEEGLRQAACVAERLARWRPAVAAVLTSDLRRAVQTANLIAAKCEVPVQPDAAWREMSLGALQGKSFSEYGQWFKEHGPEAVPPGAESEREFSLRITRAIEELPHRFVECETLAIVSHGGPICAIHQMALSGTLPMVLQGAVPPMGELKNCAIMHMVWHKSEQAWEVRGAGDATHLNELTV